MNVIQATGRRKTSVAQVRLMPGTGKITVNERPFFEYFPVEYERGAVLKPLRLTDTLGKFDIIIKASGGGVTGQAGAIQLGIARALVEFNEEYHDKLKPEGLLRRDPRMVERKKYGQKKARKRFQFSKR
ncbi:MAG TPA: 30S ribosomal protein S9 [Bacteroidota bacterium]|nr:30S ribosomal protein S9 [Candidatus Kapabacteria bacterium]HRS02531.1 30S ribosomal protein S9 [Bacteroidota bacterium]HRT67758.1 30S ribosomal protein S9 [Bacteroidota bacterium]